MKSIAKWFIYVIVGTVVSVLIKLAFEIGSVELNSKLNDTHYNKVDWLTKEYGPNEMKVHLPFILREDEQMKDKIINEINSQIGGTRKAILDGKMYTHIDEKSALAILYWRYNSKIAVNLEGAINGGYERLSQQLGEQVIPNPSGGQAIPYITKQRNISGYEALEADGNVKYKGFQGKAYTIRILAIKLDHSIYQLQYMHPSLSGYTETADSIFNSVKF